jgi:hypothetical protein
MSIKTRLYQQAFDLEQRLLAVKRDFDKYPLNSPKREQLYKLHRLAMKRTNRRYNA